MATLEQTKKYGLQERTETLLDVSRSRLNQPVPHQAPQRERVSLAGLPISVQEKRATRRTKQRPWKETIRPDYNMGVPQLMQILEPNIVWDHAHSFNAVLSKEVEAHVCVGDFFEGWHRAGRNARGVYEGNYWELLGDCDQLEATLRRMAEAPPLLEEPTLMLPENADLPSWDDFKPMLQALPNTPNLPTLRLPPFRAPILETELPFLEPEYEHLPDVPDTVQEEAMPLFFPPEELQVEEFREPDFVTPEPPITAQAPIAPVVGKPQYGHDWTGTRPFTVPLLPYVKPKLLDVPTWQHPPKNLPQLPLMDELAFDHAQLDLEPLPRLELAWEAGPEPEPAYASMATTPRTMSRAPSPLPSLPSSRPTSAATPPSTRPVSAVRPPSPGPRTRTPSPPAARTPSPARSPIASTQPSREPSAISVQPGPPSAEPTAPATPQRRSSTGIDPGKPRVWLNYEAPFSELPPIFMPPEPTLDDNGAEPKPEDFLPEGLEELPAFEMPEERPLPVWEPSALGKTPAWCPPCEPGPIGFMRGTAPVLILDVSGTMNPRQRGKFPTMKECACELLHPEGELATAAGAFDVITFCNSAWSWSATYGQRLNLLASSQVFYSGRQAGGKIAHGSGVANKTKAGAVMMPTEPDLLEDARYWVSKWPDAVGHTSMLSSFRMADDHWNADCWYLMSDGLADDPVLCMDFLDARIRHGQQVPVIHTVGFFPDDAPDNFEGRRLLQTLSAMTGGTFQEFNPNMHRIYKEGVGFVEYDLKTEPEEVKVEREWAEEMLRAERRKNIRLGIAERLDVTLARVQALHHQLRIQPHVKQHQERLAAEQAAYEAALAETEEWNNNLKDHAQAEYQKVVDEITSRNQQRADAAREAYETAHILWVQSYENATKEWQDLKTQREQEREDAIARDRAEALARYAELQAARSRTPSPPRSRPSSGRHSSSTGTRPPSARPYQDASRPTSATPIRSRPTSATPAALSAAANRGSEPGEVQGPGAVQGSRPTSARPMSSNRRSSTGYGATNSATAAGMVSSQAVASQLQQLLEEGEDEELLVDGQPSQLSLTPDASTISKQAPPASGHQAPDEHDEAYDAFDVDGLPSDMPPLELEDSQELKRRIFPAEVVQALDDSNAARLAEIRQQWAALLAEVEKRNQAKLQLLALHKDKLDQFEHDVISAYADSFVTSQICGAAVRLAVNDRLIRAAEDAYAAEMKRVNDENARLAELHQQEVEDRIYKEELHKQAVVRWERDKAAAWQQHEADVAAAKKAHADNLQRLQTEWQKAKEEIQQMNEVRLAEAQGHHARIVEEITAVNRKYRAEHAEKVKARKAIEGENLARLAAAKAEHAKKLEALAVENEEKMVKAHEEHQALCERLEAEHKQSVEVAHKEFGELRAFLTAHNDGLMEEARKRFQEAVQLALAEHTARCEHLRQAYQEELEKVKLHNEAIWPQVQMARIALAELGRVQIFAEHIRFCANKLQLGVNFMVNTPNYDRVVEMQALNEALAKAFPEYHAKAYPWPGHEERCKPGTGWVPSNPPPVLDLKDPAIEINKIVATMGFRAGSASRPVSARPVTPPTPAEVEQGPAVATPPARPPSAARRRFSGVVSHNSSAVLASTATLVSPDPEAKGSFSGSAELLGGGYSVPQVENKSSWVSRPSTASPSHSLGNLATAPVSLAASPCPQTANARSKPQVRALSAGPTLTSSSPVMQAGGAGQRPASPVALAKHPGVAGGRSAAFTRPSSARPTVPARMSADLIAMQAAINRFKSPKMFSGPSLTQQSSSRGVFVKKPDASQQGKSFRPSSAAVAGSRFRGDLPKFHYPDVDVRALDIV